MATWGSYCASKAAGNMLVKCLAVEEPELTFLSIRPGFVLVKTYSFLRVVDTPMLREVKSINEEMHTKFLNMDLLCPDVPGSVIARAVISLDHALSGEYLSYDDPRLESGISLK